MATLGSESLGMIAQGCQRHDVASQGEEEQPNQVIAIAKMRLEYRRIPSLLHMIRPVFSSPVRGQFRNLIVYSISVSQYESRSNGKGGDQGN